MSQEYFNRSTAEVANFVEHLAEASTSKTTGTFDSAASDDFTRKSISGSSDIKVPEKLLAIYDEVPEQARFGINQAILDGCRQYEYAHGFKAPADVIEQAIHNAYSLTQVAMDSAGQIAQADSHHSETLALQPNRAIVSIVSMLACACPFAHYLPADIGSNEARLAILSHVTGGKFGAYAEGALLDGIGAGDRLLASSRTHTAYYDAVLLSISGKITAIQATDDTCDQTADGVKLMRGRTIVSVNGIPVATENFNSSGSGNSPISGSFEIAGTSYTMSGNINTDTGAFSLTTTPALPTTVPVQVEGFIDFERAPELTPEIISNVEVFSLYANPFRAKTRQSIDSVTQLGNELGLDPLSESILAIQNQFMAERHYDCLRKGMRIARNNLGEFDFFQAKAHQDTSMSDAARDMIVVLDKLSQQMAEDTINHGITHLYVGKKTAALFKGMGSQYFQPSGISAQPGIYRVGRLFGLYDVYYSPKVVIEDEENDIAQILCAGRATEVGRNPIVLGDAVAPQVIPLAVNGDLRRGAGFYARNFNCINPHRPSSKGFALIEFKNFNKVCDKLSGTINDSENIQAQIDALKAQVDSLG